MSTSGSRTSRAGWSVFAALAVSRLSLTIFGIGAVISLVSFAVAHERVFEQQRREFWRAADASAHALRLQLERPLEVLESVCALFAAARDVDRTEFATFTRPALARHDGIRALEWIPRVPASARAAYEEAASADGLAGFQFTEVAEPGRMRRAADRPEYLPIYYMEPPDARVLGFDVGSEAARREPIDRASARRGVAASARMQLIEDPPDEHAIAVFCPVFDRDGQLRGTSAEVFRLRTVVDSAVAGAVERGSQVVVVDLSGPPELRTLFESSPGLAAELAASRRETLAFELDFADRRWSLVFARGPHYQPALGEPPWGSLLTGLVLSALVAGAASAAQMIRGLRRQIHAAQQLGQYTLVRKLGEGGLGIVWEARHALLRRPAALKLLRPDRAGADAISRFEREVQLTSQLTHPNTVAIYDYGRTTAGLFYYVMEYLDGLDLQRLVELDGPQPPARVVHLLKQVTGALAEAHARGLVHRDVKPANIVSCERGDVHDVAKVVDFGLVKALEPTREEHGLRSDEEMVGTPLFMAPEAISAPESVDARCDLYACGAVAYFLLTGHAMFERTSLVEICSDHLYTAPVPPSERLGQPLPPALERLVLRCLEKDPNERFASAVELREALDTCGVPDWSEKEATAAWVRVATSRFRLAAAAMAPTLPASSASIVAVDLNRRHHDVRGRE